MYTGLELTTLTGSIAGNTMPPDVFKYPPPFPFGKKLKNKYVSRLFNAYIGHI